MDRSIKIGDLVEVEIIGLQDYGAFVKFDKDGIEKKGLIHISEVQSGFVKSIREILKVGQKVTAQVIDIDEYSDKISLSMRTLEENPQIHHYYRKKHFTDSRIKIGFESLAKVLDGWVDENENYLASLKK